MKDLIIKPGQNLKTVLIDYTEKDRSNEGRRKVESYSFREKEGIQYFYGFDIKKNGIRGFLIDSINNIEITNNTYEPRWDVEF